MYNFYSGGVNGEEVVTNVPHNIDFLDWHWYPWGWVAYPWGGQEKLKGRMLTGEILGSRWGGWGFNTSDYGSSEGDPPVYRPPTHEEALAITPEELKTKPFFRRTPAELFDANETAAKDYAKPMEQHGHLEELLAKAIPARTYAIGANAVPSMGTARNVNLPEDDMKNGWPQERAGRWKHSDFKDVAFVYTYKVYERVVGIGGLTCEP
jgi:hypothetical protein